MVHSQPRGDIPPEPTDDIDAKLDALLIGANASPASADDTPAMSPEKWELQEARSEVAALRSYIELIRENVRGVLAAVLAFSAMAVLLLTLTRASMIAATIIVVGSWVASWWVAGRITNSIISPE